MTKGLMERSFHHETTLGRVREKAKLAEEELFKLRNWKLVTEQKLKLAEQAKNEFQKLTEELKKTLEDKKKEVRHAKEAAVLEYHDSDALLAELGVSYNDSFDDALRQAKALYPKLDFSSVNISVPEPTSVQPKQSDDTNELFGEKVPVLIAPMVLMHKKFYPFLFCTSILGTIMLYPSCIGLSFIRRVCRHFYFCLFA